MFLTLDRTAMTARSISFAILVSSCIALGYGTDVLAQAPATESQLSARNVNSSGNDKLTVRSEAASKTQTRFKYKVGKSFHSVSSPKVSIVHISLKPKQFNREDMLKLAEQLRRDFTADTKLSVWIFDSHTSAKTFSSRTHSRTYERDYESLRGFYDLKRDTGEEKIAFSSARGKPRDEIRIRIRQATDSAEHVYNLRGRVVDETGQPVANALVFLDPLKSDHQIFAIDVDADGVFRTRESTTVPRSVRRLYVTGPIPKDVVDLASPPFNRLPALSEPRFAGRSVFMKENDEVDVGPVQIQQHYQRIALSILDANNQPLLTSEEQWADVWLRLRTAYGAIVQEMGLSRADLERAVNLKTSTVAVAVPEGEWFIDASMNVENGPWLTSNTPVKISRADKSVKLILKAP